MNNLASERMTGRMLVHVFLCSTLSLLSLVLAQSEDAPSKLSEAEQLAAQGSSVSDDRIDCIMCSC